MDYFHTKIFNQQTSITDPLFAQKTELIYNSIKFLEKEYPMFKHWYFSKVIPGIKNDYRSIIIKTDKFSQIIGLAIIKNGFYEKKICTLWVSDSYKKLGIGSELIKTSIEILESELPLITVSSSRIKEFNPIFDKFGFELIEEHNSYYKKSIPELVFNGKLTEEIAFPKAVLTPNILTYGDSYGMCTY